MLRLNSILKYAAIKYGTAAAVVGASLAIGGMITCGGGGPDPGDGGGGGTDPGPGTGLKCGDLVSNGMQPPNDPARGAPRKANSIDTTAQPMVID